MRSLKDVREPTCDQKDCRYYGDWIFIATERRRKIVVHRATGEEWLQGLAGYLWCRSCKHFTPKDLMVQGNKA